MAYGIKTTPKNDPFVNLSHEAVHTINEAYLSPISFLLYFVPALRYLPEWCLGPSFRHQAKRARWLGREFRDAPFGEVERSMVSLLPLPSFHNKFNVIQKEGTAEASFTSMCLEELPESSPDLERQKREEIKDTASVFFAGS